MTEVIVTVDTQHLGSIDEVVDSLREAGMKIHRVLTRSGVVTGAIEERAAKQLSDVDGVLAVEEEGVKRIL
jgi:hypothetical protein